MTGATVVDRNARASTKNDVLGVATKLVADVRKALGDESRNRAALRDEESVGQFAGSRRSLCGGRGSAGQGELEDATQSYLKAVAVDPKFGLGYQGLAVMSRNLSRPDDADKYIKQAPYLDTMTERERWHSWLLLSIDRRQPAVREGIRRLAGEIPGRQRRAQSARRVSRQAAKHARGEDDMRQAVQMLPSHTGYRANLALLDALAGDFDTAEAEVKKLPQADPRAAGLPIARWDAACCRKPRHLSEDRRDRPAGASTATSGLGDLARKGRFADAVQIFEKGAAADLAAKNRDRAAIKLVSIAYAKLMAGQPGAAVVAADQALLNSKSMPVRFLAARIFVEAGALDKAGPIAAALSDELPAEPQAHGKIIEGLIALKSGNARAAIKTLTEANSLPGILDSSISGAHWRPGVSLGRSSSTLHCAARGALSLMDEGPTYGYFPCVLLPGRVERSSN